MLYDMDSMQGGICGVQTDAIRGAHIPVVTTVVVEATGGGPDSARVFAVGFGCSAPWRIARTPGANLSGMRACCRPTIRCRWRWTHLPARRDLRR